MCGMTWHMESSGHPCPFVSLIVFGAIAGEAWGTQNKRLILKFRQSCSKQSQIMLVVKGVNKSSATAVLHRTTCQQSNSPPSVLIVWTAAASDVSPEYLYSLCFIFIFSMHSPSFLLFFRGDYQPLRDAILFEIKAEIHIRFVLKIRVLCFREFQTNARKQIWGAPRTDRSAVGCVPMSNVNYYLIDEN